MPRAQESATEEDTQDRATEEDTQDSATEEDAQDSATEEGTPGCMDVCPGPRTVPWKRTHPAVWQERFPRAGSGFWGLSESSPGSREQGRVLEEMADCVRG